MTFTLCVTAFILGAAVLVAAIALADIKLSNKLYTQHADKWLRLHEQDHAKRMYDGLAEAEASAMRGPDFERGQRAYREGAGLSDSWYQVSETTTQCLDEWLAGYRNAADKPSYERYSARLDSIQPWDMER